MTLPINFKLPELNDAQSPEQITSYLQDLNFELQNMYDQTAQNVNGFIRSYADVDGSEWIPTISSTGTTGTIGYTLQSGFSRRSGIMTEIWFDIAWESIGGSTGTVYVELPYKSSAYAGIPFTNAIITETMVYPTYSTIAITADANSYQGRLVQSGSGIPNTTGLPIQPVGRIRGYLKYIGVEDE